jgi:hypothetical protein
MLANMMTGKCPTQLCPWPRVWRLLRDLAPPVLLLLQENQETLDDSDN